MDELAAFPFFDTATLTQLKTELPQYIAACAGVHPTYDISKFWHNHATERVFSLLKQSFSDGQTGALQDLLETSVMLQFNNREV